jgi:hypothetical protein
VVSPDGGVLLVIGGGMGAAADTSSAEVTVVVDVGGTLGGIVVGDGVVPVVPCCVVTVVDVGGELGVVTVVVVLDGTASDVVFDVPLGVLSANETPATVVVASMAALTIKSLWDLIDISP